LTTSYFYFQTEPAKCQLWAEAIFSTNFRMKRTHTTKIPITMTGIINLHFL